MSSNCCENMPNCMTWKNKPATALAAISGNFILLTLLFSDLGVIYLLTNFALFYIVASIIYVRFQGFMQKKECYDKNEEGEFSFVNENTVQKIVAIPYARFLELGQKIREYKSISDVSKELKILGYIFGLGYLVNIVSIYFIVWCAFNTVIVINFLNTFMNVDCCKMYETQKKFVVEKVTQVLALIPKYQDKNQK